jgi:hypothetical protein
VFHFLQTSEETDDMIAQKAIEAWAQEGSQLLPGGITAEKHHKALTSSYSVAAAAAVSSVQSSASFRMATVIKIADE